MSMDAVWGYIKENALSIIAIVISLLAYIHSRRSGKSNIMREIKKKKAELRALNSVHHFADGTTMNDTMMRRSVLEGQIDELEKML